MLTTIQENVTVERDGLIQLHTHGFKYNSRLSVVAVIETEKQNVKGDWTSFIEQTAGSLSSMPIHRVFEGECKNREKLL